MPDYGVAQRFSRASDTYDSEAREQNMVAARLCAGLPETASRILEIGCGTGTLSRRLLERYPGCELSLNDLSEAMLDECRVSFGRYPKVRFMPGDAETLEFTGKYDLICSNAAVQWFKSLAKFLERMHALLTPEGSLVFSTFGPDNLKEIRALTGRGLDYISAAEIARLMDALGYDAQVAEEHFTSVFGSVRELMLHLKRTGVSGFTHRVWTIGALRKFEHSYKNTFGTGQGVFLTWHPIYVRAQLK